MQLFKYTGILLIFIISVASLPAQDTETDSTETEIIINKLFTNLGTEESVYKIPRRLENQLSQNPFSLPENINQMVIKDFDRAFNADSLSAYLYESFKQDFDKQKADTVLRWTQKDTVRRILAIEQNFGTLQGYRKRVIGRYELEQNPPSETKKLLIEDLTNAQSAISEAVEQYGVIFRSFLEYVNLISNERNFSDPQIDNFVDNYKTRVRSDLNERIIEQYLVMYYEVSQPAMEKYVSFYESDKGQWYQNTYNQAVLEAYQKAANRFIALTGDEESNKSDR